MGTTRRIVIGGAGALLVAGLGYRAWDRGVFSAGEGPAFHAWRDWRGSPADGAKRPLHAAILAANPHDTQPWLFTVRGDSITVMADRARHLGAFDPFRREMHLGIGAAVENLMRAAIVYGYTLNVVVNAGRLAPSPGPEPVSAAHLWLDAAPAMRDPLFEAIPDRHTNRGPYLDKTVRLEDLHRLADLVSDPEVRVVFIVDPPARKELAALIVEATERIIADPQMSADSARWFRTGRREISAHRDGVTTDTAGLTPLVTAAAKIMPDQSAASADRYWLGMTRDVQSVAPVLGIVLVRDRLEMGSAIAAGRAWQRLHLAATTMGLAAQPLNQPVECVDRNEQLGRNDQFGPALAKFAQARIWEATFTFRLGYAERPALPSPRRSLDDVVIAEG